MSNDELLAAASAALIDMRTDDGDWEAIATDISSGNVVVTLMRKAEEIRCVCADPESEEIDAACEYCTFGEREPDYLEVAFAMEVTR